MADLRERHIVFRLGVRDLLRMGTADGRRRTDYALVGQVMHAFSRPDASTCATQVDADGVRRLVPAGKMRVRWFDLNGDGILEQPVILLEAQDQNILLRSNELNDAAWGKVRTTVLQDTTTGPDGQATADKLREDASVSTTHYTNQQVTISAGEDVAILTTLKASERSRVLWRCCDAGTTRGFQADVDMAARSIVSSGAFGGNGATLKLAPLVQKLANGWMEIGMVGVIDTATTTLANMFFYMCDNTGNASYTGDGASGFFHGGSQLVRASMFGSYIPTAGAAVTRSADAWDVLTSLVPEVCTVYLKFLELGTMRTGGADGNRLWKVPGNGTPALWIQASNNNAYNANHHNGVTQVTGAAPSACAVYDTVELVLQLRADGSPQLFQSKNGASWEIGTPGGVAAFAAAWGAGAMSMNSQAGGLVGRMGLMGMLVARSVLVDPDIMRLAAA